MKRASALFLLPFLSFHVYYNRASKNSMELSQEQFLLSQVQAGDTTAFGPLYDAYIGDIYRFVFYRVQKKETAEDVTSHIFLKALENISSYHAKKGNFRAWLYQITRNSIIDYYRKNKAEENIEDTVLSDNEKSKEQIETNLLSQDVQKYLHQLTPDQQEIIFLRVWEDLSYSEIAKILEKSEASCKMQFSRGIKQLRDIMPLTLFLLFYFHSLS